MKENDVGGPCVGNIARITMKPKKNINKKKNKQKNKMWVRYWQVLIVNSKKNNKKQPFIYPLCINNWNLSQ